MSKRAEEAALKRFPEEMTRIPYQDLIEAFGGKEYVDFNSMPRGYFQLGYEQAEKDTVDRVIEWVKRNGYMYANRVKEGDEYVGEFMEEPFVESLRKAMEEEV